MFALHSTFGVMNASKQNGWWKGAVLALLLIGLLSLGAKVRVPIPGIAISFTLQSLVLVVVPWFMRPMWSFLGVVLYVAAGTFGLPVFSGEPYSLAKYGARLPQGFLAAFPFIGWGVSFFAQRRKRVGIRNMGPALAVFFMAHLVLLVIGCGWIAIIKPEANAMSIFGTLINGALIKSGFGAVLVVVGERLFPQLRA